MVFVLVPVRDGMGYIYEYRMVTMNTLHELQEYTGKLSRYDFSECIGGHVSATTLK